MNAVYNYRLVALSVAIAICAAYAALDLAGRVTASDRRLRAVWLFGGASAMGFGIWAMHYIGMLALIMSVPMFYHVPTVLLSLLAAITAAAVALYTVSRSHMTAKDSVFGSLAMGGAIAAMHFIGFTHATGRPLAREPTFQCSKTSEKNSSTRVYEENFATLKH